MKLFLMMTLTLAVMAQDAKVAPEAAKPLPVSADRALTKEESLALQLTQTRILRLQDKYKLAAYQEELQPIISDQQAVFMSACKSVGIAEDKVPTECRINTGVDAEGKPVVGPDGKQVAARVWREAVVSVPDKK